jgi:RecA-family ATPase
MIRPIPANRVDPINSRWLWIDCFPLPGLTVLQGEGGLGKGLLCAQLAARLSRGQLRGSTLEPANTLIVSLEDERDVVRARLDAAGADLDRVDIDDGIDLNNLAWVVDHRNLAT